MTPRTQNFARVLIAVGLISIFPFSTATGQATYRVTEIPTVSQQTTATVRDLNESRQVIGFDVGNTSDSAFIWDPVSGKTDLSGVMDDPIGINDSGRVTGSGLSGNPVIWSPSDGLQDLGAVRSDVNFAWGAEISNSNQIIGGARAGTQNIPIFWENGSFVDLGSTIPGGITSSVGVDLNENGLGVGYDTVNQGGVFSKALVWQLAGGTGQDIGYLPGGGSFAQALGINESNEVVGVSDGSNGFRAFIWSDLQGMVEIGALDMNASLSVALDINDSGKVVGTSQVQSTIKPFIWSDQLGIMHLNDLIDSADSDWTIERVIRINNRGDVLGFGYQADGFRRPVLLTAIPEPTIALVLVAGLIGLVGRRKR